MARKGKRKKRFNNYATAAETKVELAVELPFNEAPQIVGQSANKTLRSRKSFFTRRNTSAYKVSEKNKFLPDWYNDQTLDFESVRKAIESENGGIAHIAQSDLRRVLPFSDAHGSYQHLFHSEVQEFVKYFIYYYKVVKDLNTGMDTSNIVTQNSWSSASSFLQNAGNRVIKFSSQMGDFSKLGIMGSNKVKSNSSIHSNPPVTDIENVPLVNELDQGNGKEYPYDEMYMDDIIGFLIKNPTVCNFFGRVSNSQGRSRLRFMFYVSVLKEMEKKSIRLNMLRDILRAIKAFDSGQNAYFKTRQQSRHVKDTSKKSKASSGSSADKCYWLTGFGPLLWTGRLLESHNLRQSPWDYYSSNENKTWM